MKILLVKLLSKGFGYQRCVLKQIICSRATKAVEPCSKFRQVSKFRRGVSMKIYNQKAERGNCFMDGSITQQFTSVSQDLRPNYAKLENLLYFERHIQLNAVPYPPGHQQPWTSIFLSNAALRKCSYHVTHISCQLRQSTRVLFFVLFFLKQFQS